MFFRITDDWGLPNDIDAAFMLYDDTYFFKVVLDKKIYTYVLKF